MPRLLSVLISPQRGQQSEEGRRAREKERKGEGGNRIEGESSDGATESRGQHDGGTGEGRRSRIGGGPGRPASMALGS